MKKWWQQKDKYYADFGLKVWQVILLRIALTVVVTAVTTVILRII